MGDQNKKSGGAKKIGRNKVKCAAVRKGDGSKKPKGYGRNSDKPRGYVNDDAFGPETQIPIFRPVHTRPHLCIEMHETGHWGSGPKVAHMKRDAEELSRQLRPNLRKRVLVLPKREKPVVTTQLKRAA